MAFLTGPISRFLLLSKKAENSVSKTLFVFYATADIVQNFSHFVAMCKRHNYFCYIMFSCSETVGHGTHSYRYV